MGARIAASKGGLIARFTRSAKTDALGAVPLFSGLSKRELGMVSQLVTEVAFSEGTELVTEGELGREAMVLMKGTAVVRRKGRKVADLVAGDVLGEMSLINSAPRNASVVATSDVHLLLMDAREFASLLEGNQKIAIKLLKTVAERAAAQDASTV